MRMPIVLILLAFIIFPLVASAQTKDANTFMDTEQFKKLPEPYRQTYIMGMADAFTYISRQNGYLNDINKCFRENNVTPRIAESLISKIIAAPEFPGVTSTAQAFEIAQKVACAKYLNK